MNFPIRIKQQQATSYGDGHEWRIALKYAFNWTILINLQVNSSTFEILDKLRNEIGFVQRATLRWLKFSGKNHDEENSGYGKRHIFN